jgi:O-antigen ligase/tetratricopeptide (TPR) repeat protein
MSVLPSTKAPSSRRVILARSGLMLAFAAWLGYYVISGLPNLSLRVFGPTVALHALTGAAAIAYLLYLSFRRRLPGRTFLDWPLFALLLAYGAATAASINWRVSLEVTLQVVMVTLVFCIAAEGDLLDVDQVKRAFLLVMAAAAAYALFEVGRDYWDSLRLARTVDPSWGLGDLLPPTVPRVHGVGEHPNLLAMALALTAPFYVVALLTGERKLPRLAAAGALVLTGGALFFTLSRAGWVAAGVASVLAAAGSFAVVRPGLVRALRPERMGRQGARLALYTAGLAALVAVLVAALLLASRWESRPEWLFRGSLSPRLDAMAAGGEMFRDRPLLGTGPGTYGLLYSQYSGNYPIEAVHSHNGYLQAAVDLGLPGIGVIFVVAVVAGAALWRGYRRASTRQRLLLVACGASLAGFLIHSLAEAPNASKTVLVPLAVVLALMVRATPSATDGDPPASPTSEGDTGPVHAPAWLSHKNVGAPRQAQGAERVVGGEGRAYGMLSLSKHRPWRRRLDLLPPVTVLTALVALLFFWSNLDGPHYRYSQGLSDADAGRWLEAIPNFRRAVDGDPDFALYQLQLGLSESMAYLGGAPAVLLEQSIAHLERGVALEPRGAIGHANLARAYLLAGRKQEARDSALEAMRWADHDPVVAIAAANVLEEAGTAEEARQAYADALALDASLAFSPFWSGSDFRRQNFEEIVGRSILALNPCLVAQQLLLTEPPADVDLEKAAEGCRLFILGQPGNVDARVDLATILMADGHPEEALTVLEEAVARHPDDGAVRRALGEWYFKAGDLERARHEWLLGAQLNDPRAAMLLGDSYAPGAVPSEVVRQAEKILSFSGTNLAVGDVQRYLLGILYYRMEFRRESPTVILIPGEWQDALGGPYTALSEALGRWRS